MGIYDGIKDNSLSDEFKKIWNPDPVEIPIEITDDGGLLERLKRETEMSGEIEQKFRDVCKYMYTHNIYRMSLENEIVNFNLEMNLVNSSAAGQQEEINGQN